MKVAKKSPPARRTLTLPADSLRLLDQLRGRASKSAFLRELLERERKHREDEQFFAAANAAYTPEVCAQTLRVNDEFPIHEG